MGGPFIQIHDLYKFDIQCQDLKWLKALPTNLILKIGWMRMLCDNSYNMLSYNFVLI